LKEAHVHMRSEYIDVPKGRIAQTRYRTAVMQELADFVPALSHHLKPLPRDGSQLTRMLDRPPVDGGIAFDRPHESKQLRSFCHAAFTATEWLTPK
jgi:hypothetical protein